MRARLLVVALLVALATAVVAFGVTMLQTGEQSAGPNRSGILTVRIDRLSPGKVETTTLAVPAVKGTTWPVFVVAESKSDYTAFLGRSPHLGCRVEWVEDPTYSRFSTSARIAFEDPCGGAEFTIDGTCIGGPCNRGLDRFPLVLSHGEARINLNLLNAGPPRTAP